MISFYDGQITDLLSPYFKNDPKTQALSLAIRDGYRLLYKYTGRAQVYADIDNAKEDVLDLMATELRAPHYESTFPIETKRQVVKNTNRWHQIAGTKAAVEELAKTIFGECEVYEWFEYDGQPYHFEIITNAPADPENIQKFNELLQNVKNLRSFLDAVAIHKTIDTNGNHSGGVALQTTQGEPIRCRL